jgi:Transcriptional regulator, AbiEi antitoxin/Protein of unknown function (DUF559)
MNVHTEARLAEWFSRHHGVIGRGEARSLGLTAKMIHSRLERGLWVQAHRSVYRLAAVPASPLGDLRAALLAAGADAAAAQLSAAWLWSMRAEPPERPVVLVPHDLTPTLPGIEVVRSGHPGRVVRRRGVRTTPPLRTLIDCAAVCGPDEVDDLVDRAVAHRVLRAGDLGQIATYESARLWGRPALLHRLEARGITGAPHPSVLESRMARLFVRHGLPVPKAEVTWGAHRQYRLDFCYPAIRLAIEVDGWSAHTGPERQRGDHRRDNELVRSGWTVLHYDWWAVTFEPNRVAAEILATYGRLAPA